MESPTHPRVLTHKHTHRRCRLLLIPAFVAGIFVGIYVPFSREGGSQYQAGFDAAKNRAQESPMGGVLRAPEEISTLSGTVKAISGNRITIRTQSTDPFADPELADRTVVIANDTKITKVSQGDMEAFRVDMEAFMKSTETGVGARGVQPPTPPESTNITVDASSIAAGDTLVVIATENIKTKKIFTASEVQIQ